MTISKRKYIHCRDRKQTSTNSSSYEFLTDSTNLFIMINDKILQNRTPKMTLSYSSISIWLGLKTMVSQWSSQLLRSINQYTFVFLTLDGITIRASKSLSEYWDRFVYMLTSFWKMVIPTKHTKHANPNVGLKINSDFVGIQHTLDDLDYGTIVDKIDVLIGDPSLSNRELRRATLALLRQLTTNDYNWLNEEFTVIRQRAKQIEYHRLVIVDRCLQYLRNRLLIPAIVDKTRAELHLRYGKLSNEWWMVHPNSSFSLSTLSINQPFTGD